MASSGHRRARRVLALATLVGLLAAGCGNASDNGSSSSTTTSTTAGSAGAGSAAVSSAPGVTKDEIRFSVLATKSNNPLGTCVMDCYVDGIQAYFDYRNGQGGIGGRKLVVSEKVDDELGNDQQKALQIVAANDTFATFSAVELATGWKELAKAGIPLYVWAIHPDEMTGQPTIFGHREVACTDCSKRFNAYVAQLAKAKRVATVGYGVSADSKGCAEGAATTMHKYGSDVGATLVYKNTALEFGLPNGVGPEVTAMKKAGVDLVIGCLDLNGMKTLAQEIERQGLADQITMLHYNTYDQQFISDAGSLFEGDYVNVLFRPLESTAGNSALKEYQSWMRKSGAQQTEMSMVGWINADEAYQGIKAAGGDLTRARVVAATNKMTDYTAGGLVQPIDWTRQHEPPTEDDPTAHGPKYDCTSLVKVVHGKFQVVGSASKPFLCWSGTSRAWAEPTERTFG